MGENLLPVRLFRPICGICGPEFAPHAKIPECFWGTLQFFQDFREGCEIGFNGLLEESSKKNAAREQLDVNALYAKLLRDWNQRPLKIVGCNEL